MVLLSFTFTLRQHYDYNYLLSSTMAAFLLVSCSISVSDFRLRCSLDDDDIIEWSGCDCVLSMHTIYTFNIKLLPRPERTYVHMGI